MVDVPPIHVVPPHSRLKLALQMAHQLVQRVANKRRPRGSALVATKAGPKRRPHSGVECASWGSSIRSTTIATVLLQAIAMRCPIARLRSGDGVRVYNAAMPRCRSLSIRVAGVSLPRRHPVTFAAMGGNATRKSRSLDEILLRCRLRLTTLCADADRLHDSDSTPSIYECNCDEAPNRPSNLLSGLSASAPLSDARSAGVR